MARAGRWIPARARGLRHPAVVWTYTLPVWIVLAVVDDVACARRPPISGRCRCWPPARAAARADPQRTVPSSALASVIVLAAAGTLWMRDTIDLLRFMVALLGRLPFVTPVYVYPALIAAAGLMVVPPFVCRSRFAITGSLRPALVTALWLLAVAVTVRLAWLAPAYTHEQPLRRYARASRNQAPASRSGRSARLEPGLDLGEAHPADLDARAAPERTTSVPWGSLPQPFVFQHRRPGPRSGAGADRRLRR